MESNQDDSKKRHAQYSKNWYDRRKNASDGNIFLAERSARVQRSTKAKAERRRQERAATVPKSVADRSRDYRNRKKEAGLNAWRQSEQLRHGKRNTKQNADAMAAVDLLAGLKEAAEAGETETNLRRSNVKVDFRYVGGRGWCVFAGQGIKPITDVCDYGGRRLVSKHHVRELLHTLDADKILRVRDCHGTLRDIWWDGSRSTTYGPRLNHACSHECSHESNIEDDLEDHDL